MRNAHDEGVGSDDVRDRLLAFGRWVAVGGGLFLVVVGLWALIGPQSFYESLAAFEPYNRHFIQDIGAFQIGLGAVLLIAAWLTSDALAAALLGTGVGGAAHLASHLAGLDLGGTPALDVPFFTVLAGLLLAAGWIRLRRVDH